MVAVPQTRQDDTPRPAPAAIVYPDSDGQPMADNTKQWDWIALLKINLDAVVPDFVAGDLLWYPVEGHPEIRTAPDVLVALGRPKGYRGSYMQWREDRVPPAVVFEVLSPSNSTRAMMRKSAFYQRYGAREQIVIDPDDMSGWAFILRENGDLEEVPSLDGWVSPLLGIRFALEEGALRVYRPNGAPFMSPADLEQRAERLAAKLRELGIDPDLP